MPVVSAINLKGGVGKTSICLHLAGALALMGKRVLAVDNDPQSSLTAGFLGAQPTRQLGHRQWLDGIVGPGRLFVVHG